MRTQELLKEVLTGEKRVFDHCWSDETKNLVEQKLRHYPRPTALPQLHQSLLRSGLKQCHPYDCNCHYLNRVMAFKVLALTEDVPPGTCHKDIVTVIDAMTAETNPHVLEAAGHFIIKKGTKKEFKLVGERLETHPSYQTLWNAFQKHSPTMANPWPLASAS